MPSNFNSISTYQQSKALVTSLGVLIVVSILLGIVFEFYPLFVLPAFVLLGYLCIVDFKKVFYFLLFCIPLSTEINLPGGFGTDLPTEPLIIGLMFIYFFYVLKNGKEIKGNFLRHPISLIILLHLSWILITSITSENFIVSLKFLLAKSWYVAVFYFMAGSILKTEKDIKLFFWCIFSSMAFTVFVILIRHAFHGFAFDKANSVLSPFYRNHVVYASVIALFFPFIWFARKWYIRWSRKWWGLVLSIVIFLIAIQLSYTRTAYVALIFALGSYYVIQLKLMKVVLSIVLVSLTFFVIFMAKNNTYLGYAPDFEKTIVHSNFDNLVEATYKMQDVSTMERVYRWVAGGRMVADKPFFGFGPGNFYNFYKSYTVLSFETYVSDNPEKSGIHSYYLMTAVEQGYIGIIIFFLLSFYILIKGEVIYHQTKSPIRKDIILMLLMSIIVIDALLIINDMIETDKVGSFYFMCIAILVNMDLLNQEILNNSLPANDLDEKTNT